MNQTILEKRSPPPKLRRLGSTAVASVALLVGGGCIDTSGLVFGATGQGGGGEGASGGEGGSSNEGGMGGSGGAGEGGGGTGGGATGTYAAVVQSDQPLGYWPLDELVNGVFTEDLSGNGHDAYVDDNGDPSHVSTTEGAIGGAITLGNGALLFVGVPHPFSFSDSSYTLEAWVRREAGDLNQLWSCQDTGDGYTSNIGSTSVSHKHYDSAGSTSQSIDAQGVALTSFRHVVVVFDHTADQAQIFVDGAPATPPQSMPLTWPPVASAFSLASAGFTENPGVAVDEIAVYDATLSADRIEAHYLCGAMQQCD